MAAGQQRPGIVKQHNAVAQQAPPLLGITDRHASWIPQLAGYLVRIPARTSRLGRGPGPLRCMIHRYMHWRNQYW